MNTDTTTRYAWIDAMRGMAALSVFVGHALSGYADIDTALYWWRGVFGAVGVAVFLVLSGYVVAKSLQSRSLTSFWQRRFWRLYPAYWLAIALYLMTGTAHTSDPVHVVLNATMIPGLIGVPYVFGVFWSLSAEMVWYILASLGLHRARLLWLVLPVSLVLRLVLPDPLRMAALLPLFAIGAALYHYEYGTLSRRHMMTLAGLALPIALIGQRSQDATGAMLVLAGLALVYVLRHRIPVPPVFVWLGTVSYSLYLLHYMVIAGLPLQYIAPWFVTIPVWLAVSLLTAWLAYRYVERPLMHGIRARRTTPQSSPK